MRIASPVEQPEHVSRGILGIPFYWYGEHAIATQETTCAAAHGDLPAPVCMHIGEYEQARYRQTTTASSTAEHGACVAGAWRSVVASHA
ncbi:hypothetical protein J7390_01070 [Xanthomonas phaseoli pv. manihotis]|uniref:Uncharacterized protein n=1 Tax=Xanthomonas manihotis TaxID=43353 RepID=A0A8I1XLH8_XANMN|nr:hypothetical protein [Xanthomonas phaseoli pv. manihotis]RWU19559.1 hypothetical protein XANMN_03320 [Xanthomonas phaseoli pv. manihotis str. CIO151]MBO9753958.1 hypothetical protein [Xanthomonas phaseoli pv. manihotis]MBO9759212.1 hypothetical protein [Xanthomonas phaseoli pv. manihotis]MBO9765862.1 hypothetical protein [Xanthomonas phaseoli pv. manihotis]